MLLMSQQLAIYINYHVTDQFPHVDYINVGHGCSVCSGAKDTFLYTCIVYSEIIH